MGRQWAYLQDSHFRPSFRLQLLGSAACVKHSLPLCLLGISSEDRKTRYALSDYDATCIGDSGQDNVEEAEPK